MCGYMCNVVTNSLFEGSLVVGVHHDLTGIALLAHVGPRVATSPSVVACGATELSEYPALALIGSFLWNTTDQSMHLQSSIYQNLAYYTATFLQ